MEGAVWEKLDGLVRRHSPAKHYLIEFIRTRKGTRQVFAFEREGALANAEDMIELRSDGDLREMCGDDDFQFGTPAEFILDDDIPF
jgi:hypothetical protein